MVSMKQFSFILILILKTRFSYTLMAMYEGERGGWGVRPQAESGWARY